MPIRPRVLLSFCARVSCRCGPGPLACRAMQCASMFQSSPPDVTVSPSPTYTLVPPISPATATASPTPSTDVRSTATGTAITLPGVGLTPTLASPALPSAPSLLSATATITPGVRGYLPPPTLTAPGAFASGAGLPQLIGPRSPASPQSVPTPVDDPGAFQNSSATARVIDSIVAAFGYLWLCCGAILLSAAALLLVWLARRRKPAH